MVAQTLFWVAVLAALLTGLTRTVPLSPAHSLLAGLMPAWGGAGLRLLRPVAARFGYALPPLDTAWLVLFCLVLVLLVGCQCVGVFLTGLVTALAHV